MLACQNMATLVSDRFMRRKKLCKEILPRTSEMAGNRIAKRLFVSISSVDCLLGLFKIPMLLVPYSPGIFNQIFRQFCEKKAFFFCSQIDDCNIQTLQCGFFR